MLVRENIIARRSILLRLELELLLLLLLVVVVELELLLELLLGGMWRWRLLRGIKVISTAVGKRGRRRFHGRKTA